MSDQKAPREERFLFRNIHPDLYMGTASDRYAGWIGQIYTAERYEGRITRRRKKLGGRSFIEEVLPVDSVREYFDHFRVLELDYTFYSTLLDENGAPTKCRHVLESYARHLTEKDRIILKAPQRMFARKLRQGASYVENSDYLDAELFTRRFFEPALALLGKSLAGVVFEQEYHRSGERVNPEQAARDLDGFFSAIPQDGRYHVELRTESYLTPRLFEVCARHGIGQVLSHWTWLPTLRTQFAKSGKRFTNSGGSAVIRLMTPRGMRYEDAYARAHPFNGIVEGMLQPQMVEEAAELAQAAVCEGVRTHVIVNNRSGGNAPLIAKRIANRLRELLDPTNGADGKNKT